MAAEIENYNSSLPAAATQLSDDALAFIGEAIAYNTRRAYAAQLKIWFAYCEQLGRALFPADPVAVANWIAERANSGERSGKRATDCKLGQSMSTLRVAVAAIKAAHDSKGIEFDTGHVALRKFFQGLRRKRPEAQIQAAPLRADVLVEVISSLGSSPIEARDAALLALGYIFARRRSELAGLDLGTLGTGDGYLTRDARHLTVTLLRHKTQGNEPEVYVVPRAGNSIAVAAIEHWIAIAGVTNGQPLLRKVHKTGAIGSDSLDPQSISAIIKRRVAEHLVRRGVTAEIATQEAARYSGHSLRHGFAATAAEAGASLPAIKAITGHRSDAIVGRYLKQADKIKTNAHRLPGVGLDSK